jgi:hypothetical protein
VTENPLVVLLELSRAFDRLGIDYVVVGSIASSIHGEYRASGDIDIVANIRAEQIQSLVRALETSFYIDAEAVSRAVALGRKFNVIHLSAIFKADIFAPSTALGRQQLVRRQLHKLDPDMQDEVWVATAEDMILYKLDWYRTGEGVSEVQWRDIRGIIGTRGEQLDFDYLRQWADHEGLTELLGRALLESQ